MRETRPASRKSRSRAPRGPSSGPRSTRTSTAPLLQLPSPSSRRWLAAPRRPSRLIRVGRQRLRERESVSVDHWRWLSGRTEKVAVGLGDETGRDGAVQARQVERKGETVKEARKVSKHQSFLRRRRPTHLLMNSRKAEKKPLMLSNTTAARARSVLARPDQCRRRDSRLRCTPICDHVVISATSSSVPYPPGRPMNAYDKSATEKKTISVRTRGLPVESG